MENITGFLDFPGYVENQLQWSLHTTGILNFHEYIQNKFNYIPLNIFFMMELL